MVEAPSAVAHASDRNGSTPGLSKAERAAAFLDEHQRRMARSPSLRRWECRACGSLIGKYRPPVGLVEEPCRKCGTYNDLTTEPVTAS